MVIICESFFFIIIVNYILKGLWGRARPEDVMQYGGSKIFTPWFSTSDACISNCSFVSGDAAVGFSFIVLYFLTKISKFFYLSILGFLLRNNNKKFIYSFSFLFLISIILELLHYFIPNRAFELNDLYANSLGVLMAYLIFKILKKT